MKLIGRFLKPYRKLLTLTIILLIIQTVGTLFVPALTAAIVDKGIASANIATIIVIGLQMLGAAILTGVISVISSYFSSKLSAGVGRDIRNALFKKTQELSLQEFNTFGTSSMITRTTTNVNTLEQSMMMVFQMVLPAPIMCAAGLILTASADPVLMIIPGAAIFLFLCVAVFAIRKTVPMFTFLQTLMDKINKVLRENIIGIRVIRAFDKTNYEEDRVNDTFETYAENAIRVNKIFAIMIPIVMLIMNFSIIAIVWFGSIEVTHGTIYVGSIMAIIEYTIISLYFLIMAVMVLILIPKAAAASKRIGQVLDTDPSIKDPEAETPLTKGPVKVEFKDVTFAYKGAENPVLHNLSFSCRAGETTGIIGGTGSGKSTIANLFLRFYDIEKGDILVEGQDIKNMKQKTLRDQISFVPQRSFLFHGTIEENLRYGNKEATMEEIQHAANIAQATTFINETEGGFEGHVAQGGNNFSGGQRQRLCIARALVKKAPVYFFDDSFSALDFKTDAKLRASLTEELTESAVVIVAQRINTIMDAGQIIVLDDGEIVGIGTHKELMATCSVYQEIAYSQLSQEETA